MFDLDDTIFSNAISVNQMYTELGHFNYSWYHAWIKSGRAPNIPGALEFYNTLYKHGYLSVFLGGETNTSYGIFASNLKQHGFGEPCKEYQGTARNSCPTSKDPCYVQLTFRSPDGPLVGKHANFAKPIMRQQVVQEFNVTIAGLFGDQFSDIYGQPSAPTVAGLFKLPNPMYYLP